MRYLMHERRERRLAHQIDNLEPGSVPWLIAAERLYGGCVRGVKRGKVSRQDPRSTSELKRGGMIGGDRMSAIHNNYSAKYSQCLLPIAKSGRRIVVVEVGILRGTGVAMWSDLFPNGRVIGLDIDLGHIRGNLDSLKARGAFRNNNLDLHEFDQLEDNRDLLRDILGGDKINIYIDDGLHTDAAVLKSLRSVRPHLDQGFTCLIEDNSTAAPQIALAFPDLQTDSNGRLTVVTP